MTYGLLTIIKKGLFVVICLHTFKHYYNILYDTVFSSLILCNNISLHDGSILHGVDPLSYFSFQPVLHDWCNKGCGMCYRVCGMVHIKEPLLLIGKSSPCGGSGFPLSLSEWSFTICPTPYNRKIKCVECVVK